MNGTARRLGRAGAPDRDDDRQRHGAGQEPAKGERAREVVDHRADPYECRCPQRHGHERRTERDPVRPRRILPADAASSSA